jgi:hypothetical protein
MELLLQLCIDDDDDDNNDVNLNKLQTMKRKTAQSQKLQS